MYGTTNDLISQIGHVDTQMTPLSTLTIGDGVHMLAYPGTLSFIIDL